MGIKRTYRKRWLAQAIIALCVLAMAWPTWAASADGEETSIDLQSNVAYQGSFKDGRWYPARLELTNESDKPLKGDLVLSYLNGDNGTTDAVVPLELPPGSPLQVTIGVPGVVLNKDTNRIAFYEGGYQNGGKEIKLSGRGYLDSRNTLSYMIGVVSRDPDTFNFMPQLNQRGYDIIVNPLLPDDLPEESQLLDSFDALVINDTATVDWSEARVAAIKNWVTRGGTLVLAGGAGYDQTAKSFADIAPVASAGTAQLDAAPGLAAASGEELALPRGLTVSTGETIRGSSVIVEGGIPLAVTAEHGFGDVVYAAFDPSLEPLASWSGSAMLWAKLLSSSLTPMSQINGGAGFSGYMNVFWQLNSVLDLFPSIKQPAFMLLIGLLAIYILIIAPILYILLSKADRREWAWWLIPVLSIVMGVTVFMIGSGDKRNVMAHTVELVELSGDDHAVVSGGTAVFTPTGGTVTTEFDEAMPIRMFGGNGMGGGLNGKGHYQLFSGSSATKTVWKEVPYWSTRKLWMDRRAAPAEETGTIGIDMSDKNGVIRMNVTNGTQTELTDVHYLYQGAAVRVGNLGIGESGEIILPTQSQGGFSYFNYGGTVFPYPSNNSQNDEFRRQRELIEIYFGRYNGSMFPLKPLVIGFSTNHDSRYEVNGDEVKTDNLRMWIKELSAIRQSGSRATVPPHAMTPIIASNTFQNYSSYGDGSMQFGVGEMELEYMVPSGFDIAFDKLDIGFPTGKGGANATWQIWKSESAEWTELPADLGSPATYLTEAQSIRLKLVSTGEGTLMMPQLTLEGEVLQP